MATHRLEEEAQSEVFCTHRRHCSIISAHQTQDESIQSNDVVLPDHIVQYFNAFVELLSSSRCRKFIDKEVCESPHMGHQCAGADAFKDSAVWGEKGSYTSLSMSY